MSKTIEAVTPQQKANQRFYAANRDKVKTRAVAWTTRQVTRNRDLINAVKANPCTDCGERRPPYVMQFDHVRGVKRFNLADASSSMGYATKTVIDEIFKCEVVCANCHADRTWKRRHGLPV